MLGSVMHKMGSRPCACTSACKGSRWKGLSSAELQIAQLAEKATEVAFFQDTQAAELAEAALACLRVPSRALAEAVVEYFEALNTVPVARRAPHLGPPLFQRLLPALLGRAQYPEGFTAWEESGEDDDDDADAFQRFRCPALCFLLLIQSEITPWCFQWLQVPCNVPLFLNTCSAC